MKENYGDILDRLGEPDWWDWYGVPRYGEPARVPEHLMGRIRCQHCAREFRVALVGVYIPIFADPESNPRGCKLILLTKPALSLLKGRPTPTTWKGCPRPTWP